MRSCILFFLLLFLTVFISCETVWGAYQLEYKIEVYADGSATWVIEHRFVKGEDETLFRQLSDWTYFGDTFVKNIKLLVNATKEKTGRMNMTVENFVMTTNVSGSYSVVKYQFHWTGFAETEDIRIRIGDVFEVDGLFLYGEGTVEIMYPSGYTIESVSPRPHVQSGQKLTWYGIKDFGMGEPKVVFVKEKATSGFIDALKENALMVVSLIAFGGISFVGFYYFKLRKKEVIETKAPIPPVVLGVEDDEEKVVNLLRTAGGSLYQSSIANSCGFSRAKTSKLLKIMESKGKVRREKKGREKVVTLINGANESKETRNRGKTSP